jgi:hypothetical protein
LIASITWINSKILEEFKQLILLRNLKGNLWLQMITSLNNRLMFDNTSKLDKESDIILMKDNNLKICLNLKAHLRLVLKFFILKSKIMKDRYSNFHIQIKESLLRRYNSCLKLVKLSNFNRNNRSKEYINRKKKKNKKFN